MPNKAAQALGRLARGKPKTMSRLARTQRQLAALGSAAGKREASAGIAEKYKCYRVFYEALKSHQITHKACYVCGWSEAQAHHEDYSKPLDVVWLCRKHHDARHRELNETRRHNAKRLSEHAKKV